MHFRDADKMLVNPPKLIRKQCLQHLGRVKHGEIKPSTFYALNNETQ